MKWKLVAFVGLAAMSAAMSAAVSAQDTTGQEQSDDVTTSAAPAPPIVIPPPPIVLRETVPASPPARKKLKPAQFGTLEEEIAEWGATPISSGTWPVDKKEAKRQRTWMAASEPLCLSNDELKSWIAKRRLEACDQLLGAPRNPAWGPAMRARLLQGRAIALAYLGGHRLALQTLDEADKIGEAEHGEMYTLSAGLGSNLLRAFAHQQLGEDEAASALLDSVRAARPYAGSLVQSADLIEVSYDGEVDRLQDRLRDRVRIDPDVQRLLFISYVLQGKMDLADQLGDRVTLTAPKMRGNWTLEDSPSESETIRQSTFVNGLRAYAAGAMGSTAKTDAILAEALGDIASYRGQDPSATEDRKSRVSKKRQQAYYARAAVAEDLARMVESFKGAIALRARASELNSDALLAEFQALGQMAALFPIVIEQLGLLEGEEAALAKVLAKELTARTLRTAMEIELDQLPVLMPKMETIDQVPKLASSGSKWLFSDGSGWSQSKERGSDIRTVRYETLVGSKALMEEMLLLAIAQLAEKEGFDSFVMLSNRTFGRVTQYVGYGGGRTVPAGFESQARVMLLNSQALPPEMAGQAERLITVAEIQRELQPRYDAIMTQKEAEKAAAKERR